MLCCRFPYIQRNQSGSGHTDNLMNFHKTFFSYANGIIRVSNNRTIIAYMAFLLLGSFTNLVMCIYVLKIQTIKLAHTLEIDCFLTCNKQLRRLRPISAYNV